MTDRITGYKIGELVVMKEKHKRLYLSPQYGGINIIEYIQMLIAIRKDNK